MKTIIVLVGIGLLLFFVSRDRHSIRVLELLLPPHEVRKIRLKFIIPGYSIWKLRQVRKDIHEQSRSENNPKRG